jgi:hypothetical protein
MDTVHGYHDGERVRDVRDGTRGTVRFLDLDPVECASGDYAVAEVRWDGLVTACELDVALPHLARVASDQARLRP